MLVARAQLDFIRELIARFERDDSMMRPVADFQSQYIAIIALLRSVGHVFEKVDCMDDSKRAWSKARWSEWKREPIFHEFIEPTRNALLKEFQGGLQLRSDAFSPVAVVVDPSMPDGVSHVAGFDAREMRDFMNRPVLPNLHAAVAFWDRCLKEAEAAFARKDSGRKRLDHLLEVGLNFLAMARNPTCGATDEHVFQNVHWGLELVLKAYLHHRGWTDARCRAELGHDIALALAACERAGLTSIDADARALISALSPFSKKHQVAAFVTLGAAEYTSCQANEAANAIAHAVCLTTDRADRRGKPSPKAEPYVSADPFCGGTPQRP